MTLFYKICRVLSTTKTGRTFPGNTSHKAAFREAASFKENSEGRKLLCPGPPNIVVDGFIRACNSNRKEEGEKKGNNTLGRSSYTRTHSRCRSKQTRKKTVKKRQVPSPALQGMARSTSQAYRKGRQGIPKGSESGSIPFHRHNIKGKGTKRGPAGHISQSPR